MACGVPVIASSNSSLTEILGDAAIFINPYNVNSIKQAIKGLLADQGHRDMLIKRGYLNVEKYYWKKTAEDFLKLVGAGQRPVRAE